MEITDSEAEMIRVARNSARLGFAFQHDDVSASGSSQVIRNAGADDPATDDDHIR